MRESIRTVSGFLRFNWGTLALGLAFLVALLYTRNYHRFVHVADSAVVLDTRTGRYCSPWPNGSNSLPRCSDLANSWH